MKHIQNESPIAYRESSNVIDQNLLLQNSFNYIKPPETSCSPRNLPENKNVRTSTAQPVTQQLLDTLFKDFIHSYSIELLPHCSSDGEAQRSLEEEGCPICLLGSENALPDEGMVVFTCLVMGCKHAMHEHCISENLQTMCLPPPEGISFENFHSVEFLSIHPFFKPELEPEMAPATCNRYLLSLEISHLISSSASMKIEWPEPIYSHVDQLMSKEFILFSLEKFLESSGEESEMLENLPMFRAKRGRIIFTCEDMASSRVWRHQSNYDIYYSENSFLFLHVDPISRNVLTLGLRRETVSPSMMAYALLFVRYEISPEEPQTPLLQLSGEGPSFMLPGGPGFGPPSPLMRNASPFFVQNDGSPVQVLPTTTLYKVQSNSTIMSCLKDTVGAAAKAKVEHAGRVFDFTPLSSPINAFSLPATHSPSLLNSPDSEQASKDLPSLINDDFVLDNSTKKESKKGNKTSETRGSSASPQNEKLSPNGQSRKHKKQKKKKDGNSDKKSLSKKGANLKSSSTNSSGSDKDRPDPESLTSALLYDVSVGAPTNKPTSFIVSALAEHMLLLSKSQFGSRFIQENLQHADHFPAFFRRLCPHGPELMVDGFGHYALEALFAAASDEEKAQLLRVVLRAIVEVSCHKQGSFSLQSLMESVKKPEHVEMLVEALEPCVKSLSVNCSGHYVILRFIQKYGFPCSNFIAQKITQNVYDLATDHYGLRVVKAVLEVAQEKYIGDLFDIISSNTRRLVEDQFGNYAIQHALVKGPEKVKEAIKKQMDGRFVVYSRQKFSSNVVEKCLKISETWWRRRIVRQLISCSAELINDKYGNYCLQTALLICDEEMAEEFTKAIYPSLSQLRDNVQNKWIKLIENTKSKFGKPAEGLLP